MLELSSNDQESKNKIRVAVGGSHIKAGDGQQVSGVGLQQDGIDAAKVQKL